ncbi:MAG: DUF3089 domain-containing protein [Ottowia sp.]|nr:DUF3089 domain-containing protein [Ottowia sp.]
MQSIDPAGHLPARTYPLSWRPACKASPGAGARVRLLIVLLLAFGAAVSSQAAVPTPSADIADGDTPAPIDYSQPANWLALPGQPSAAMRTPRGAGFSDLQAVARADVFYVHPTTSWRSDRLNAPIDDAEAIKVSEMMLLTQATPFNAVARIYAPRYRQVTLPLYQLDEDAQQAPNNRAYADVLAAFKYYVAHHNGGRPFFLVGHSQGTNHAQRLLSEAIQGTPLEDLLVAAYLPGQPIPRAVFRDDLTRIPPCTRPAQTGCVAIWETFGEHTDADLDAWQENGYWNRARQRWMGASGQPLVNINPVSWDTREPSTPASRHRGAVPFGTQETFARVLPQLVAARSDGRFTYVSPVPLPDAYFNDGDVFGGTNYHVFDIALFWLDLRENAHLRLNAWMEQHGQRQPLLDATTTASARVGQAWRHRIATRHHVDVYAADNLPPGLTLDPERGLIAGTPREAGTWAVRLTAGNAHGVAHGELALTVTP